MKSESADEHLCFTEVAGMKNVFQPACGSREGSKKHPCTDCHFCQFCSDARCHSCRGERNRRARAAPRKLSLREQILLYDQVNSQKEKVKRAPQTEDHTQKENGSS